MEFMTSTLNVFRKIKGVHFGKYECECDQHVFKTNVSFHFVFSYTPGENSPLLSNFSARKCIWKESVAVSAGRIWREIPALIDVLLKASPQFR